MAKNKKSFILYADLLPTIEALNDKEAGILFKHLLRYVNDQNPCCEDRLVAIVFEPIKQQLKRDLKDWEDERQKRSKAGHLGGLASAEARRSKTKQDEADPTIASNGEANQADNVTVTVNDTVLKTGGIPFSEFWNLYNKKQGDKARCEKKWNALTQEDQQTAIKTIPDFKAQCSDKKFQPYPETYLNQKRWNDELSPPREHVNAKKRFGPGERDRLFTQ